MDNTDYGISLLSMMVVFLLLIMLASIHAALKRNQRMERKMDAIMEYLSLDEERKRIDAMGARNTKLSAITEGGENWQG